MAEAGLLGLGVEDQRSFHKIRPSFVGLGVEDQRSFHRARATFIGLGMVGLFRPIATMMAPTSGLKARPGDIIDLDAFVVDPDTAHGTLTIRFEKFVQPAGPWSPIVVGLPDSSPDYSWNTSAEPEKKILVRAVSTDEDGDGLPSIPILIDFAAFAADKPGGFAYAPTFGAGSIASNFGGG